jgi:hypothetical protein
MTLRTPTAAELKACDAADAFGTAMALVNPGQEKPTQAMADSFTKLVFGPGPLPSMIRERVRTRINQGWTFQRLKERSDRV